MPDNQQPQQLRGSATIDIVAAVMVERFGSRAAEVAAHQLAAAHAGEIADRWFSIVMSIEDRLNALQTVGAPQSNVGET